MERRKEIGERDKREKERERDERWREKVMKTVELSITISNKFCCQPSSTNPPAI